MVVLEYDEIKLPEEVLEKWRTIRFWPWREQVKHELFTVMKEDFDRTRRWIRKKSLSLNAAYTIELHSTPGSAMPFYQIDASLFYFIFNRKLKETLESCVKTLNPKHRPHHLSTNYGVKYPAYFDHMLLELWHNPRVYDADEAYVVVKDICEYLSSNYNGWKSKR